MTLPELQPELWSHIISFVRRPLSRPASNSGETFIRRISAASCAFPRWVDPSSSREVDPMHHSPSMTPGWTELTKQEFHEICVPHLYRIIVTQDLPLLFDHLERPSEISGVTTKSQSLQTCQRLFTEYKQYGRESGYAELLRRNDWGGVGMTVEERETWAVDEAHHDICGTAQDTPYGPLVNAIRLLSPRTLGRLQTLSMCPLGTPDPLIWTTFFGRPRSRVVHLPTLITAAVRSFNKIHYCQHMTQENPLSLDLTDLSPPPTNRKATTAFVHILPGAVQAPCVPWTTITCVHHDRMLYIERHRLHRLVEFDYDVTTIKDFLQSALAFLAISSKSATCGGGHQLST